MLVDTDMRAMLSEFLKHGESMVIIHTQTFVLQVQEQVTRWHKYDRPSPDHTNAKVILLASSHLCYYFNPHAQRILEGNDERCKINSIDPKLSNTASMADEWLPTYPGSESAVFMAIAKIILEEKLYDTNILEIGLIGRNICKNAPR